MQFKYNEKDLLAWVLKMRNYVIGVYPGALPLLKWAEDQQHRVIYSAADLALKDELTIDTDPIMLSRRVWSWIQLTLHDNSNTKLKLTNSEALNGLEVWRKLVVAAAARTPTWSLNLRDAAQQPEGASTWDGTEASIVVWDEILTDYLAVGASMPEDEDLAHSILKMLPSGFSMEMKAKAHADEATEALREWICQQAKFHRHEDRTGRGAHVVERGLELDAHSSDEPELEDDCC